MYRSSNLLYTGFLNLNYYMILKEGDILHCHTTLVTDSDDVCFIKGRFYEIEFVADTTIIFINECNYNHTFSTIELHKDDYRQWFHVREEQLRILLDD